MNAIDEYLHGHIEQQIEQARMDLADARRAVHVYSIRLEAWEGLARRLEIKLPVDSAGQRK